MANKSELAVPTFLRQWRKYRGLTQEELAELIGVTAPLISQLETEKVGFSDKSLARLAEGLKCSPADLLAYDPRKEDSLWPLMRTAESLPDRDRKRIYGVLKLLIEQAKG